MSIKKIAPGYIQGLFIKILSLQDYTFILEKYY